MAKPCSSTDCSAPGLPSVDDVVAGARKHTCGVCGQEWSCEGSYDANMGAFGATWWTEPGASFMVEARELVLDFFGGDKQKTEQWFASPNPLLGGISPYEMNQLGRSEKLCQFVKSQLIENEPPKT